MGITDRDLVTPCRLALRRERAAGSLPEVCLNATDALLADIPSKELK